MPPIRFKADDTRAFIQIARGLHQLKVLIICEGDADVKDLEALDDKFNLRIPENVGYFDCGGIDQLTEFAIYVATLIRLAKKTKKIFAVLDADTSTPRRRINSFQQSLVAQQVDLKDFQLVSGSIFRSESDGLDILVKIAGDLSIPYRSHEREDYTVRLLTLNGEVNDTRLRRYSKSSDFVESLCRSSDSIIRESPKQNVKQAYRNMLNLLGMI
jgi:hypothetical protein